MNQFISSNQAGQSNPQSNKHDQYRFQVPTIPSVSNMLYSPRSDQNYLIDNFVCQSFTSPLGSSFQLYSPLNFQPVYNSIEISTPVYLANPPRHYVSYAVPQDDLNGFKLPLKMENLRPDLVPYDIHARPPQQSFRAYSRDNSTQLKSFLHNQLVESYGSHPSMAPPPAIVPQPESVNDPDVSLNQIPPMIPPGSLEGDESPAEDLQNQPDEESLPVLQEGSKITNRFENFTGILFKIFSEGKMEEATFDELPRFERELLYFLVKRKYQPKTFRNPNDCNETPTFDRLTKILMTACNKRPEECYKFILTRVIKYLKHKFESSCKTKAHLEEHLYEVYFRDTAAQLGVPLSDFHYPLTGSLKGKFKLNSVYFSKIFKSQEFVTEVKDYCQSILLPDYSKDILKKLNSLLSRWSDMLIKAPERPDLSEREILHYVKFNKRCKLPWSVAEVKESIEKFLKLVASYEGQPREEPRAEGAGRTN